MELFDLEEGKPNSFAPEKRPFIIPAFVTKDQNPYEFWSNGRRLSTTRTRTNLNEYDRLWDDEFGKILLDLSI
jgi:gamma-glutamyltranspeptidase